MNLPRFCAVGLALFLAAAARAASPDTVLRARALIGPEIPARVVRIENRATGPSRYPSEFYGLVIPFADILWLYTEFDGTQNLSVRRGRLAEDNARLGELLQAVEPGLAGFADVADPSRAPAGPPALPPNGCFLACLVRWQQLQREPDPPRRARLIACYPPDETRGHMLLEFWRQGRRYVYDPDRPGQLRRLPRRVGEDALAVAAAVVESRWAVRPVKATPVELPVPSRGTRVAGEPGRPPSRT